jgi:hypothetical protein
MLLRYSLKHFRNELFRCVPMPLAQIAFPRVFVQPVFDFVGVIGGLIRMALTRNSSGAIPIDV